MSPDAQPHATSTAGQPSWMAPVTPVIPDHELVRRIGGGSYGDVWLARTAVGTWRAVKVVFRDRFTDSRPYEREFSGMLKFEPLSRGNEAFVDILQIGRNEADGYFYYVMELADDAAAAAGSDQCSLNTGFAPATYVPKTLSKVLLQRGRLPVGECLELGLTLNLGLAHLHRAGLIHRDIKPSNLIFVGGVPKLADIGLVIDVAEARSFVGTEGFIPPEGPNSPQADLYSLGKVLYEAGMGKDRKDFPEPLTQLAEAPDSPQLLEFNAILLKACAASRTERYQSAEEMNADLALLQSGGSVRQQRKVARQLRFVQRAGALVTALAAVIALGWWWQSRQTAKVRELATENLTLAEQANASAALARKNEATARESLYAADINLAQQALRSDNLRLARSLLQNHVPQAGQPDLRGFEWRYLWHQCQSEELFSLSSHTNASRVLALAPDGRLLAVGGYEGGHIRLLDLSVRQVAATLADANLILSLAFAPDGEVLASGSRSDVRLYDAHSFQETRRLTNVAAFDLSGDGRTLAFTRSSLSEPADVFARSLDGGETKRLGAFNETLVASWKLGRVAETNVPGWNGEPVQSWVVYPPGFDPAKKWPLLQMVHGGPHGAWHDEFHLRWNPQVFAAAGYVVAGVNFHGSTGWGQAFVESSLGRYGEKEFADVEAVTDALLATGFIDPDRLTAAGGSFGGYMMAVLNGRTSRYRAHICHAGVFNWESMLASDFPATLNEALGTYPWDDRERYLKQSAHMLAKNYATPTLVVHGELDYRVPVSQGFEYYNTLRLRGVPARLLYFPDENHWILKPQNSRLWHEEFLGWLARYAPGGGR